MARKYAGPLRGSFWAIVVVLFVLAAWQPAARMYVDWRVQRNVSAIETARRAELGVATAEFEAGRVQILQQIRDLQARGDYAAALKLGGRYQILADPEMTALYDELANAQGRKVRLAEYAALIARDCNEAKVQAGLTRLFAGDAVDQSPVRLPEQLNLSRVATAQAVADVRTRVLSNEPAPDLAASTGTSADEHNHRARVHSDFSTAMLEGGDELAPLVCVWKVAGVVRSEKAAATFETELWLAPKVNARELHTEPLWYRERQLPKP